MDGAFTFGSNVTLHHFHKFSFWFTTEHAFFDANTDFISSSSSSFRFQ
ncbi:hypothetical protein ACPOL_0722 [Acidisarcina polymorpha]|uniref:Uncharacterized protein n=1 Tax=Acidisarcina polymorpha TaxID=2211140 RepID=A0A2Z5FUQ4_9BACT|nr:hypothetical protein ACPOL_0722 [Acidisarcina polymorpha]